MSALPWTPVTHQPLQSLAEGLWVVDAPTRNPPIGRRMTALRLADGSLAVHSAVAVDEATLAALLAAGPIRWIVVPNGFHRLDAPRFAARFPDARVVCPPAAAARVGAKVAVAGGYELLPPGGAVRWEYLAGVPAEGVFVHTTGGATSLVFNDAFFNLPDRLPGFAGWVTGLLGSTGGPKVTRIARLALVKDRRALADHLRRLAALPGLVRVIPGHGAILDDAGAAVAALHRAADGLAPAG